MPIYGIDAHLLARKHRTGVELYAYYVLQNMMKQPLQKGERVVLYTHKAIPEFAQLPDGWEQKVLSWSLPGWTYIRLWWELFLHPPHVFYSPAHVLPYGLRVGRAIGTVHDIAFLFFPDRYPLGERIRQVLGLKRCIRKSDPIVAVSETTKNDLVEYGVPADRIDLVLNATDTSLFPVSDEEVSQVLKKFGLKKHAYAICVGRVVKKKNSHLLAKAFAAYRQDHSDGIDLVYAGPKQDATEDIEQIRREYNLEQSIHLLGFVSDAEKAALLTGARMFVFPSAYEGFGVPALEAMAAGTPVIVSDTPALQEVVDDAGTILPADNVEAWAEVFTQFTTDAERAKYRERGFARVQKYSWQESAKNVWKMFRQK